MFSHSQLQNCATIIYIFMANMKFYLKIPYTFPSNITKTIDLIVPEGTPPLLIWIHGGSWNSGEKWVFNDFERFCFHGYAVMCIEYRYSTEASFPAQLEDCRNILNWARESAKEYGYNPDQIMLGGCSAGGHLAALLGLSEDVCGVVDCYGPANLITLYYDSPDLCQSIYDLLGCSPSENPDLYKSASPYYCIENGKHTPFLILHGSDDPLVPRAQGSDFYKKLSEYGYDAEYFEIPGGGHGYDSPEANAAIDIFVSKHLPIIH